MGLVYYANQKKRHKHIDMNISDVYSLSKHRENILAGLK